MDTLIRHTCSMILLSLLWSPSWAMAQPSPPQGTTLSVQVGGGKEYDKTDEAPAYREPAEPRQELGLGVDLRYLGLTLRSHATARLIDTTQARREYILRTSVGYYQDNMGVDLGVTSIYNDLEDAWELLPCLNAVSGWDDLYFFTSLNSGRGLGYMLDFNTKSWLLDVGVGHKFKYTSIDYGVSLRLIRIWGIGLFWGQSLPLSDSIDLGYTLYGNFNEKFGGLSGSINTPRDYSQQRSLNVGASLNLSTTF